MLRNPVSELRFGFLASSVINNLESENYQVRLATIKDLITTVQTTASTQIDVDRFLDYMVKFFDDENIIVAEKSCLVIETLCTNLYGNVALYKNHLLKIAVSNLGSKKKFLYIFGQNILHSMIQSISPQAIISELFSMTLMSSSRTMTQLFNFIKNEVNNNIIPSSLLTKYAFIFEDSLNSDDINLVRATQNCLQAIKSKDSNSFFTIAQRIKISTSSSQEIEKPHNYTPISTYKNFGLKIPTLNQNKIIHTNSSEMRNAISPTAKFSKANRSFVSHATFALPENDNIDIITSKPGSADDSRVPTSRVSIGISDDIDVPQIFEDMLDNSDISENKINSSKSSSSKSPTKLRLLKLNLRKI